MELGDLHGLGQQWRRIAETAASAVMHAQHRFPAAHRRADPGHHFNPDARIDDVVQPRAPRPERDRRPPDELGVERRDVAASWRSHVVAIRGRGQAAVIVDDAWIATLELDDGAQLLHTGARCERIEDAGLRARVVLFQAGRDQHPRGEHH